MSTREEEGEVVPPQNHNSLDAIDLTEEDSDGSEDKSSPVPVREQRVAKARRVFGLN